jgi:hypothetical protein
VKWHFTRSPFTIAKQVRPPSCAGCAGPMNWISLSSISDLRFCLPAMKACRCGMVAFSPRPWKNLIPPAVGRPAERGCGDRSGGEDPILIRASSRRSNQVSTYLAGQPGQICNSKKPARASQRKRERFGPIISGSHSCYGLQIGKILYARDRAG